ncbi:MAG: hypothetical protein ACLFN8_02645 [Candidatus Woesearchaeota archaeon]
MRRSQASVEFLITYSWAILIILLVIGTLIYIQINPRNLVPESCELNELDCLSHKIETDKISLEIRNTVGQKITIIRTDCEIDGSFYNTSLDIDLDPGKVNSSITCEGSFDLIPEDLVRANVVVYYTIEGQEFPRSTEGNVVGYVSS